MDTPTMTVGVKGELTLSLTTAEGHEQVITDILEFSMPLDGNTAREFLGTKLCLYAQGMLRHEKTKLREQRQLQQSQEAVVNTAFDALTVE